MVNSPLSEIVSAQKRGEAKGIYSICSANRFVIEASFIHALDGDGPVLIESTCNQVNQYGGYTGMTPAEFADYVWRIADACQFPHNRLIIGGDHLGPNPWQHEPAAKAMDKSRTLIRDCVLAGYAKFHLDASMKCANDDPHRPLDKAVSAERAAELALVAEDTFARLAPGGIAPRYVIGTEVPIPGGAQEQEDSIAVTTTADVEETIEVTRRAFLKRGLEAAWQRVIAVVVQPGVEYGDNTLFEYDHERALELSRFIKRYEHLVYEAHSTDYQTPRALKSMVEDQFAILKVGPALTFAFREAVFALAMIEAELFASKQGPELSRVREVLEEAMLARPVYWEKYYQGDPEDQRFARKYSFSDRSRYYWPVPEVQTALAKLITNLAGQPLPLSLLSQYLPVQYERIRNRALANSPRAIILDKIASVLTDYAHACEYTIPR